MKKAARLWCFVKNDAPSQESLKIDKMVEVTNVMAHNSSALFSDIAEAVAQVFDVVCVAIIVKGQKIPVFCSGDQAVGQWLTELPDVHSALADGRYKASQTTHTGFDTSIEAAFVGITPLRTLPGNAVAVFAIVTRQSGPLDSAMALVHRLTVEVDRQLTLINESPALAEALSGVDCGVTIADVNLEDSPLVYVNNAFLRMTGYSRARRSGQELPVSSRPASKPAWHRHYSQCPESRRGLHNGINQLPSHRRAIPKQA